MATISDVAKHAGVAVSTVSYSLSGARPISAATRARIERAMEELDYTPNALARGLKERRSRILAFLLPTDRNAIDLFTMEILVGAAERARGAGYHLLLWTEPGADSVEVRDLAREGLVDGALIMSVLMDDARIDELHAGGMSLVTIGRTQVPGTRPFVDTDDVQTAELAIACLADRGHESIVFVAPPASEFELGVGIVVRLDENLHAAADRAGLKLVTTPCEWSTAAGADLARRALDDDPELTAMIVLNSPAIAGVLSGIIDSGRAVPEDVSVVELLPAPRATTHTPFLVTSISPQPADLGAESVAMMIDILEGHPTATQRLLPSDLTERGSVSRRG